jgi:hypothetical protein
MIYCFHIHNFFTASDCIGGVMVSVLISNEVYRGFEPCLGLKTIKLVPVAFPLSMHH